MPQGTYREQIRESFQFLSVPRYFFPIGHVPDQAGNRVYIGLLLQKRVDGGESPKKRPVNRQSTDIGA
jgi:hypothetical protein